MTPRIRRRPRARGWFLAGLIATALALYAVLVPIQAVAYDTLLPLAMVLGAGVCGAPLLSIRYPRAAATMFCASAFVLPPSCSCWSRSRASDRAASLASVRAFILASFPASTPASFPAFTRERMSARED